MTHFATVTALPTGSRTADLGVDVQSLTTDELERRTSQHGICADVINDKYSGAIADERWFPNHTATPAEARDACAGCPVIAECLEKALRKGETFGIWGGTTPEQRLQLGLAVAS